MLTCNILKIAQSARSGFSTVISGKKKWMKRYEKLLQTNNTVNETQSETLKQF